MRSRDKANGPHQFDISVTPLNTDSPQTTRPCDQEHGGRTDWTKVTTGLMSGEPHSLEFFYEHFFDLMLRQARSVIRSDEQTCLDIVQDSMLKVLRCIKPMHDEERLTAWTRAVVNSVAFDWLRKEARFSGGRSWQFAGVADMRHDHDTKAKIDWIEKHLEQVDPQLRQLISWRYRLGWTLQRIACRCGLKTGAVDGRIRRALAELRRIAEAEFDE